MSKLGKPISQRQLRVGEMIKQALGMIFLRDEAKIGTFDTKEITVTEVRMSQDLKIAKAYVLPLGGKNAEEIIEILKDYIRENLRNWFKKEKWVRIDTQGNIAGKCGTMKKGKPTQRCLPLAKARSLTKKQRAATARKKVAGSKRGKQFVKNTPKAKVSFKKKK